MSNNPQERKAHFSEKIKTASYQSLIAQTIPDEKRRNRFLSSILSAVAVNAALKECEPGTILAAAFLGESLGLSPSPQLGHFYMIPFEDKKANVTNAVFVLGYKGYIQMAIRSGAYKNIIVTPIKQGELIGYNRITETVSLKPIENDITWEATETIGYYARIELAGGFVKEMYWSKEKMQIHADRYSKAFSMGPVTARDPRYNRVSYADYVAGKFPKGTEWLYSSFWYKDFDSMALKTMLRQMISKWGVMSQDLVDVMERDNAIIAYSGGNFEAEPVDIVLANGDTAQEQEIADETTEDTQETPQANSNTEPKTIEIDFDDL